MKFGVIRRILRENLIGGDVPKWVDGLLTPLNQFLEQTYLALNGNLTFADNFAAKEIQQTFTHAVELEVNPQSSRRVSGIFPVDFNGEVCSGFGFSRKGNGNIGITINFTAGAGTESVCRILIFFG